jgi:RNA polymerase sigma factor (sigma-70 family)
MREEYLMAELESPRSIIALSWDGWETALRTGDRDAFRDLVMKLSPIVQRRCLMSGVAARDLEDVTQEVFIWVWQHRCEYQKDKASLSTWIVNFAVRRCCGEFHRKQKRQTLELIDSQILDENHCDIGDGDDDDEQRISTVLLLESIIAELPEHERGALERLLRDSTQTNKEIAAALGISEGAAKSLLSRAKKNVRERMDRQYQQMHEGEQTNGSA